jgi:hypothetical protein
MGLFYWVRTTVTSDCGGMEMPAAVYAPSEFQRSALALVIGVPNELR